jgi:hypothetical protein
MDNVQDTAKKAGKAAAEAITVDKLIEILTSESAQNAAKKLYGKIFNFGPNDEAIVDNAVDEIKDDINDQVKIRKEWEAFLKEMKKAGWSTEWLKAVLVKKNRDWQSGNKGKSPAAKTIEAILQGRDFDEKVEIATSELTRKTVVNKVKEGWTIVKDKSGKLYVVINPSKFKNFVAPRIEAAKVDAKEGFSTGIKTGLIVLGIPVLIFIIILLYSV